MKKLTKEIIQENSKKAVAQMNERLKTMSSWELGNWERLWASKIFSPNMKKERKVKKTKGGMK